MSIQKTCPYCGGRGYITHIEALPDCGRAWTKRCIACEGTGLILYTETNADRLSAMSDEEKAKELTMLFYLVSQKTNAEHYILDWLQQPAKEDT